MGKNGLDIDDLDPIFKVTHCLGMLKNGLSAPFHLTEMVNFDQTFMEKSTGEGAELIIW